MKTIVISLVVLAVMATALEDKPNYDLSQAPQLFERFVKDYHRQYKDDAEREENYKAFVNRLETINKANSADSGVTFDINKFADYTQEEIEHMFGLSLPEP